MNKHLTIILFAVFSLSGCSMTPPYTQPQAPVPARWPTGPAYMEMSAVPESPAATEIPWREFFTDERLQKVIETALDNNRDLRLAALNVQRARAIYGIQRSALFPAVDATASGSKHRVPADLSSSGRAHIAEQYDVSLGIFSWEIDFFGRIRSLKDQALEQFLATQQAGRSARLLMVSAVADAFLVLAGDRENSKLAQTTFETQKSAFDLIKRRFEAGLASRLDLNRAQTQVDAARGDLARYTLLLAQDENRLNLLAGAPTALQAEIMPEGLADIRPFKKIFAGISSELLLRRPDILYAENLLKAANANIGAARAGLFPRISLTTFVGTASAELSGLFGSGSDVWNFTPNITAPIFDSRLWSALDVTLADKEIAITQYEKAIQTAFREVADALAVRGTLAERLAAQQSLVNAAAESFRLSNIRYDRGIDSYLSVLDAQRALYAAQQALVAIRLADLTSQVRLYAVLGGGAEQ